MFSAALETRISTVAECIDGRFGELVHRLAVGQVEVDGDRFAALRPDRRRGVLARSHPSRPEHHRVPERGQRSGRRLSDARRRPGDHRWPPLGIGLEAGHQRSTTVVGSAASPRTLIEWTRSIPWASMS